MTGVASPDEPETELVRAIPISNIAHPLVDQVGESGGRPWTLTESRAPVVILDSWRIDLLRRCTEKGRELVLATDETSALTPVFVHVWREAGAHWMVRNADGGLRDGFTGRPLSDVGDLWSPAASTPTDIAVRHLRPLPTDAVELTAVVSMRMPARGSSPLGNTVTELFAAVGDQPKAWGSREPGLRAWDVEALTSVARKRMPRVQLVVRGDHAAAVVRIRRTRYGLEETTYASMAATGGTDLGSETATRAVDALTRIASNAMPLVGLVLTQRGRRDLLRVPFLRSPVAPIAMLIGPPVAKELRISPAGEARRVPATPVGRAKLPGILYPLATDPDDAVSAWAALERVIGGFDPTTRAGALGAIAASLHQVRPSTV